MPRTMTPRSIMVPLAQAQPDTAYDELVCHCLAAHAIIGEHGSTVMQRLIELLLFEVGCAMAANDRSDPAEFDASGSA